MRTSILTLSLLVPVVACSSKSQPEPASQQKVVAQVADGLNAKEAAAADAAAEPSDEEGCIYAEGHKDEADPECAHGPGEALAADGEPGHFGAPFNLSEAKPLAEVIAATPREEPVLVRGEVEAVCQKKGCWMVIKDGADKARILMKDHGFAVPMDSRGKTAVVEGTLASRTFDEAQVKHLEKDGGGDPSKVSGTRTEHVLTATGIEIKS